MTFTFITGTPTLISANFVNPYTGALLAVNGTYYINDTYLNGGPDADDALAGSPHDQIFSLEDDMGNLLLEDFEQFFMGGGDDILLLASTTNILGDLFIQVSSGNDIVWSNAGNDVIGGGVGDDILHGGPGNDDIDGGNDNDILIGGQGDDTLHGGSGIDVAMYSGVFSNYVITESGGILTIEDMVGTDGTDTVENVERIEFSDGFLEGGVFTSVVTDDTFIGTAAVETFDGGGGIDTVDYSASISRVKVKLTTGGLDGDADGDTYISIENIIGTNLSARDYLYGDAGDNYIQGLGGSDYLLGGAGADILDGGSGNGDYARYEGSSVGVDVDLTRAVQIGGDAEGDVLLNIENLYGSSHDDILTGDAGSNYLEGFYGNDIMSGGLGNDRLIGGHGDDTYIYSAGKDRFDEKSDGYDTVVFDAAWAPSDVVISGNILSFIGNTVDKITFNNITLFEEFQFDGFAAMDLATLLTFNSPAPNTGTSGDDTFIGTGAVEAFDGGGGIDTVDYSASTSRVKVKLTTGGLDGDASGDTYISIENIIGTNLSARDYLYGDAGDNYIQGLGGSDYLLGGAGADILDGGSGNGDYARYEGSSVGVDVDLTRAVQIGGDAEGDVLLNIENLYGSSHDDILTGDAGSNYLEGFNGNDVLNGGLANDRLIGGHGDDTLYGGEGNDVLEGGTDSDDLYGENGDDTLYGGSGNDNLTGGSGADTFAFEGATAFIGIDNVLDFSLGEGDMLDISDLLSGYDPLTDAISDFVQITDNGTDSILSVDFDGGANDFIQIATLTGITGLTDEDALETSGNLITV